MPEGESHLPTELLLIGAVFFAPFAFGTTESWSKAVLAGTFSLIFFLRYREFGWPGLAPAKIPPAFWGVAFLVILAGLQAANPVSAAQWEDVRGLFTFSRLRTLNWIFEWALYAGILFFLPNHFRNPQAVSRFAWALLICGVLVSLAGYAQLQAGNTHYLGVRPVSPFRVPFGPFPNKNHAGTFLAICALAGAGLAAAHLGQFRQLSPGAGRDEFFGKLTVITALEILVLAGLFQARSLGAVAAAAIAAAVALTMSFRAARGQQSPTLVALSAVVICLVVAALSFAKIQWAGFHPGAEERAWSFRIAMATDGLKMIAAHPFFGTGLGALRVIYPSWISPTMKGYFTDHLHCDPVELAVDAGIPAALFYYAMLGLTFWKALGWGDKDTRRSSTLLYFLGAGFLAFVFHQAVDFPAFIVSTHFLAMLCLAACWGQLLYDEPPSDAQPPSRSRVLLVSMALTGFIALVLVPRIAAAYCDLVAADFPQPSRHYYQVQALNWEPTFERQWKLGDTTLKMAADNPAARLPLLRMARNYATAALALEPLNPDAKNLQRRISFALRTNP